MTRLFCSVVSIFSGLGVASILADLNAKPIVCSISAGVVAFISNVLIENLFL